MLEYLSSENPTLDQEISKRGANTSNPNWSPVTGLVEWKEFNYDTLISRYGDVLNHPFSSFPDVQPPLTGHEREIWDENFLSRAIMPSVILGPEACVVFLRKGTGALPAPSYQFILDEVGS